MGTEDEIAVRLQQGATPRQLLAEGFRKSTIYKVADALKSRQSPAPKALVSATLTTDRDRYLPGQNALLSFSIANYAPADLYVFQAGVRPEWLPPSDWIPDTQRRLVGSGDALIVRLCVPMPDDLSLGEKDLFFGIQGQWVGPHAGAPTSELMWTGPLPLFVQHALNGDSVFISASVASMSVISQLESTLDDYGIATIIAGDADLAAAQIDRATYFAAIVSDLASIPTVHQHVQRAQASGKHPILIRDAALAYAMPPSDLSWVDLNFRLGATAAIRFVFQELDKLNQERSLQQAAKRDETLSRLLLALGAVVVGVAIAKSGSK